MRSRADDGLRAQSRMQVVCKRSACGFKSAFIKPFPGSKKLANPSQTSHIKSKSR